MKAVIETKLFANELKKVMLASNSKQFSGAMVENPIKVEITENGTLKMTAYNMTIAIESELELSDWKQGTICVNAKTLKDIVTKLVSDTISIEVSNNICLITSGNAKFSIPYMDSENFAELPDVGEIKPIRVDSNQFVGLASKILYAAATDDKRPVMRGVSVEIEEGNIDLVASDGFRLAKEGMESDSKRNLNIIIPAEAVYIFSQCARDGEAEIFASRTFIRVKFGNTTVTSRLIDGKYLDWRRVVAIDKNVYCTFDKNELIKTVEMALTFQIVGKGAGNPIIFEIEGNKAKVSLKSRTGEFEDEIEFETNGNLRLPIAFNPRFMIDSLKSIEGDKVEIFIVGALSPCIVRSPGNEKSFNVLLPVRIKKN